MLLQTRLLDYKDPIINGVSIQENNSCKVSYTSPFNKIDIEGTPIEGSLGRYEVRVTGIDDPYDIGVGIIPKCRYNNIKQAAYWASLPGNKAHSFSILVEPETFVLEADQTSKTFRLSFYARSAIDGSWDMTYFLFTVDGLSLGVETGDEDTFIKVLTKRDN